MLNRGFIGVGTLWITAAVSALAFAVLLMGRWHQAHGAARLQDVRLLSLVQMAAAMERESQFQNVSFRRNYKTGSVFVRRTFTETPSGVRLVCSVEFGRVNKDVEVGFQPHLGRWRATYWREM